MCMIIIPTDHTAEIAVKAGAIVRYEYQGKGNVIRRMFQGNRC